MEAKENRILAALTEAAEAYQRFYVVGSEDGDWSDNATHHHKACIAALNRAAADLGLTWSPVEAFLCSALRMIRDSTASNLGPDFEIIRAMCGTALAGADKAKTTQ